jgi:hypothetical protein
MTRSPARRASAIGLLSDRSMVLAACSSEPEFLRLVAMGDTGTGGPGQLKVAAVMVERAREDLVIEFVDLDGITRHKQVLAR